MGADTVRLHTVSKVRQGISETSHHIAEEIRRTLFMGAGTACKKGGPGSLSIHYVLANLISFHLLAGAVRYFPSS